MSGSHQGSLSLDAIKTKVFLSGQRNAVAQQGKTLKAQKFTTVLFHLHIFERNFVYSVAFNLPLPRFACCDPSHCYG
ncbi:hypothetical protein [Thioclava sp. SK-1]|uniref:hypothetical protein n=1 Tax=Thioclava sp. SK-1 TaxID=1889770 RepID=UPI00159EFF43|nr:hypothetical protein [Thioclava sp. SK-1]